MKKLPKELIAQKPIEPRDHSRLLVLKKEDGSIDHKKFFDIVKYFKKGDVLVAITTSGKSKNILNEIAEKIKGKLIIVPLHRGFHKLKTRTESFQDKSSSRKFTCNL